MADGRLRFTSEAGPLEVSVCTPRIVRVTLGAPAPLSFVEPRTWAPVAFESAGGEPVRVATRDLRVEVETRPLRLAFADAAGEWLLREPDDGGMSVETGGRVRGSRSRASSTSTGSARAAGGSIGWDRRASSGTRTSVTGPARTSGSRC